MSAIGQRRLLKAKNRDKRTLSARTYEWWVNYFLSSPRYAQPMKLGDLGLRFD